VSTQVKLQQSRSDGWEGRQDKESRGASQGGGGGGAAAARVEYDESRTVRVAMLPIRGTALEADLRKHFGKCGDVSAVDVNVTRETAFVVVSACVVLCCIVLYCIVLYCIVLYCIGLYCIVLYWAVLYCIVLHLFCII
jgi:hypothetical protein